jgi:hypothetical protein
MCLNTGLCRGEMNSNPSKIGYDIEFQKFIGSISHSLVFFNILSIITGNIEKTERAYRYSSCSHLGRIGVCITHGEMADYLLMSKNTVKTCMQNLISQKIIGMDYVILEMIRCPFFYIEENGKAFCDQKKTDLRFLYMHILEKTRCISDAVVHGHISYWNKQGKIPLTTSMIQIAKSTGLTYRQIQFSIKKLKQLDLIIAENHVDSRYVLTALHTQPGVIKNVGGCDIECIPSEGIPYTLQAHSVDILDGLDSIDRNRVEEEAPPTVFACENEDKKSSIERTYRNGWFGITESEYHELQKNHNQADIDYVINRYNREWDERSGPPKRKPMAEFRHLMGFRITDNASRKEKEDLHTQTQEEKERLEREQEDKDVQDAFEQAKIEHKEKMAKLCAPIQEIKTVETAPSKVVHMKSIESTEEKSSIKQKIMQDVEQERENQLVKLYNMIPDEEKHKYTKPKSLC